MYYLYGIERLIQLSTESAFGKFSIIGGLILLGTSVARAIVTRKIATRGRKLMGKVLTDQHIKWKTKSDWLDLYLQNHCCMATYLVESPTVIY